VPADLCVPLNCLRQAGQVVSALPRVSHHRRRRAGLMVFQEVACSCSRGGEFDPCRVGSPSRPGRKAGAGLPHSKGRRGDRRNGSDGQLRTLVPSARSALGVRRLDAALDGQGKSGLTRQTCKNHKPRPPSSQTLRRGACEKRALVTLGAAGFSGVQRTARRSPPEARRPRWRRPSFR
jgi:hypothetical protein